MPRKTTDSALADVLQLETVTTDCYRQVRDQLREVVIRLGAKGTLRLPSEAELSTALGVSRATLRSALQALQQEGRIRRLHGRGTFINRYSLGVGANLAEAGAFVDLLGQAGYEPSVRIVDQRVVELGEDDAVALDLAPGAPALQIERVFDAGGEPAVHSVDLVPATLLGESPQGLDAGRSTFEFVETHIGPPVCYSVAEVRPVLPSPALVQALHIPATQPLLRLRHTHIRDDEQPVAVTVAHINDEYLRFSVIRTYLDD